MQLTLGLSLIHIQMCIRDRVYIGDETPVKTMKDCSVVTATYELGEGMKGTIGIIGPKRMDYEHVMKTLKILQGELDAIYNKDPKGQKGGKPVGDKMSKEDMIKEAVEEAKAEAAKMEDEAAADCLLYTSLVKMIVFPL